MKKLKDPTSRRIAANLRIRAPQVVEFRDATWYDERVFALID